MSGCLFKQLSPLISGSASKSSCCFIHVHLNASFNVVAAVDFTAQNFAVTISPFSSACSLCSASVQHEFLKWMQTAQCIIAHLWPPRLLDRFCDLPPHNLQSLCIFYLEFKSQLPQKNTVFCIECIFLKKDCLLTRGFSLNSIVVSFKKNHGHWDWEIVAQIMRQRGRHSVRGPSIKIKRVFFYVRVTSAVSCQKRVNLILVLIMLIMFLIRHL